jgi:hypothetical protein
MICAKPRRRIIAVNDLADDAPPRPWKKMRHEAMLNRCVPHHLGKFFIILHQTRAPTLAAAENS